jgi:CheY-like chemotaxis protein
MRVLIVEDEALVSMMLEDMINDLGHTTVGPAASVAEAINILDAGGVDGAILDVNLSGETVYPVAEHMMRLDIPFAFATGYGTLGVDPIFHRCPVLQKPFDEGSLEITMNGLVNSKKDMK